MLITAPISTNRNARTRLLGCISASVVATTVTLTFHLPTVYAQENPVAEKMSELSKEAYQSLIGKEDIRIAVMEFAVTDRQLSKQGIGESIAVMMESHLKELGAAIVERRNLAEIIREMELSVSGLLDPDTAVKVGKVLGATTVFSGSVAEIGTLVNINLRVVDVESGEVLFSSFATLDRKLVLEEAQKYVVVVGGERSLILSGLGSAIIPGVGQFYSQNTVKGVVLFSLVATGVVGYLHQDAQARGFEEDYEKSRALYLRSITSLDIEKYRSAMAEDSRHYQKARRFQNTFIAATAVLYVYGIIDAVRSAWKFNEEMNKKYGLTLRSHNGRGVLCLSFSF